MRVVFIVVVCAVLLGGCQSRAKNPEIVAKVSRNDAAEVAAYLINGGDPNLKSRDGDPLLYIAAGPQGGTDVAERLIAGGADINGVSAEGRSVLHNAASWCFAEMVVLLLAAGAHTDATDKEGKTPLDVVCKQPQDRRALVLNLLMSAGG